MKYLPPYPGKSGKALLRQVAADAFVTCVAQQIAHRQFPLREPRHSQRRVTLAGMPRQIHHHHVERRAFAQPLHHNKGLIRRIAVPRRTR